MTQLTPEQVADGTSLIERITSAEGGSHCPTCTCTKLNSDGRKRKPQDGGRWPPSMTAADIEACIDHLCGCAGRHDCDCVSVFNMACRDAWYDHNTALSARGVS